MLLMVINWIVKVRRYAVSVGGPISGGTYLWGDISVGGPMCVFGVYGGYGGVLALDGGRCLLSFRGDIFIQL